MEAGPAPGWNPLGADFDSRIRTPQRHRCRLAARRLGGRGLEQLPANGALERAAVEDARRSRIPSGMDYWLLWSVSAHSARDVWALGESGTGNTIRLSVVYRWNGRRWRAMKNKTGFPATSVA